MKKIILAEDNLSLQEALSRGLSATGQVEVIFAADNGRDIIEHCMHSLPDAAILDVHLNGDLDGIETAVQIRKEFPRFPVVFYSIQDDDSYFRSFRRAGILSHYAYVRKSNYLMPDMIIPLVKDAVSGKSFIDPEIEARVQEVRVKDENDPMSLLEPNERQVARLLATGMTNEQIAQEVGFRDKRTISRVNGQIYAAWQLKQTKTDEKIARTRAAMIVMTGEMLIWDDQGQPLHLDERGNWVPYLIKGHN